MLYETQIFDSMSNIKFLFFLPLIMYKNVTVNRGINCWRLTFGYDNCHFINTLVNKTSNLSKNDSESLLQSKHKHYIYNPKCQIYIYIYIF